MKPFGSGSRRICAVAAAATAGEMRALVLEGLRHATTIELRLDWLRNDRERFAFLKWLKRSAPRKAVFLATCRRRIGGGEFAGDAGEELFWLIQAKQSGCAWCDLEIETLRELPGKSVRGYDVPAKVLLSIHDFRRTPKLPVRMKLAAANGFDAVKVAAMSRTIADSVRLLRFARGKENVVAIPMGEIGLPARLLALREGGGLAYAPIAAATAPGQVGLRELKELYRADRISKATQVFGVIGDPIGHSLSPLLHNSGYIAAKRDAVFLPFLVENLRDFLRTIADFGVRAFAVTLPHKQTILRHLHECEPLAREIGAVNTVTVRRDGSLHGSNTDYIGVLRALEKKMKLRGSRVVIFGAGGAARAAAFAVSKAGGLVFICARRPAAARALARAVGGEILPRAELRRETFDAILNATPIGMHPHAGVSPLARVELNCSLVMDLIYRPLNTKLLRTASQSGIRTVSGAEMFLAQGIAQWELWMGRPAPEAAMRAAVLKALRAEEKHRW